jgi:hypothetical protein
VHVRLTHLGLQEPGHHAYAPAHQPALPHLCWAKLTTIQGVGAPFPTHGAGGARGGGGRSARSSCCLLGCAYLVLTVPASQAAMYARG